MCGVGVAVWRGGGGRGEMCRASHLMPETHRWDAHKHMHVSSTEEHMNSQRH